MSIGSVRVRQHPDPEPAFDKIPRALSSRTYKDGKRPGHLALWAAIYSMADWKTLRTGSGRPSDRALIAYQKTLMEYVGIRDPHTFASLLRDLEEWGFVEKEKTREGHYIFQLHMGSPRKRGMDHPASAQLQAPDTITQTSSSEDSELASANTTWDEARKANLRKAVGNEAATPAIAEIDFRIANPEVAGTVEKPAGLARTLADCYRGRCKNPSHSELHGEAALGYHRARRADHQQATKAAAAKTRPNAPVADLEAERRRQIAALTERVAL